MTDIDDGLEEVTLDQRTIDILTEIYDRDGKLTPEAVLDDARLRDRFEWDDAVAAHSYRLEQARRIIRSVKVIIEETKVREFHYVPSRGSYAPVREVMSDRDVRAEVLAQFEQDANRFAKKWADMKIIADAWDTWVAAQAAQVKPKQ